MNQINKYPISRDERDGLDFDLIEQLKRISKNTNPCAEIANVTLTKISNYDFKQAIVFENHVAQNAASLQEIALEFGPESHEIIDASGAFINDAVDLLSQPSYSPKAMESVFNAMPSGLPVWAFEPDFAIGNLLRSALLPRNILWSMLNQVDRYTYPGWYTWGSSSVTTADQRTYNLLCLPGNIGISPKLADALIERMESGIDDFLLPANPALNISNLEKIAELEDQTFYLESSFYLESEYWNEDAEYEGHQLQQSLILRVFDDLYQGVISVEQLINSSASLLRLLAKCWKSKEDGLSFQSIDMSDYGLNDSYNQLIKLALESNEWESFENYQDQCLFDGYLSARARISIDEFF